MRSRILVRLLAATTLWAVSTSLSAAVITAVTSSVAGGSTNFVGGNLFTGSVVTEPGLFYHDNTPIDLLVTVDGAGTYQLSEAPLFGSVENIDTGTNWIGFQASLISSPNGSTFAFLNTSSDNLSVLPTIGIGGSGTPLTFSGGTVAQGAFIEPVINFQVDTAGTYDIRQTPIAAPEPGTIVLLSLGAIGLLLATRHRRAG